MATWGSAGHRRCRGWVLQDVGEGGTGVSGVFLNQILGNNFGRGCKRWKLISSGFLYYCHCHANIPAITACGCVITWIWVVATFLPPECKNDARVLIYTLYRGEGAIYCLSPPAVDVHRCTLQGDIPKQRLLMGPWIMNCQSGTWAVPFSVWLRGKLGNSLSMLTTLHSRWGKILWDDNGLHAKSRTRTMIFVFLFYGCLQIHWRKRRWFCRPAIWVFGGTSAANRAVTRRDPLWPKKGKKILHTVHQQGPRRSGFIGSGEADSVRSSSQNAGIRALPSIIHPAISPPCCATNLLSRYLTPGTTSSPSSLASVVSVANRSWLEQ